MNIAMAVSDEQRVALESMVRSQTIDIRASRRARIVLLASEGMGDREIARQLGIGRIQAARWRGRFAEGGLAAIQADLPRSGRKPRIDSAEIVRVTTQTTPEGATHWSTRKLGAKLGISDTTVLNVDLLLWLTQAIHCSRSKTRRSGYMRRSALLLMLVPNERAVHFFHMSVIAQAPENIG